LYAVISSVDVPSLKTCLSLAIWPASPSADHESIAALSAAYEVKKTRTPLGVARQTSRTSWPTAST